MATSYMFIDGAYLDACVSAFCAKWFDEQGAIDYEYLDWNTLGNPRYKKFFYYDALPLQRKDEAAADFASRLKAKEDLFERLRRLDGWHVHLGIAKRHQGKVAQQKEVDVLLACDMLTHAHRKNMDQLAFVAGDQDFRPLLDAVVRDGMYVTLIYDPAHTSGDLINMADARRALDCLSFWKLFSPTFLARHPVPVLNTHGMVPQFQHGILEQVGYRDGVMVARVWRSTIDPNFHIATALPTSNNHFFEYRLQSNLELLKRVFQEYEGPIEWASPP